MEEKIRYLSEMTEKEKAELPKEWLDSKLTKEDIAELNKEPLIPIQIEAYNPSSYKINHHEEKLILTLLLKKDSLSIGELAKIWGEDNRVGFSRACKYLTEQKFRFHERDEPKSLIKKVEKYRGRRRDRPGFKFGLNMETFLDVFFYRYRLHFIFSGNYTKKIVIDLVKEYISNDRFTIKRWNRALQSNLKSYHLESLFEDIYDGILEKPKIKLSKEKRKKIIKELKKKN